MSDEKKPVDPDKGAEDQKVNIEELINSAVKKTREEMKADIAGMHKTIERLKADSDAKDKALEDLKKASMDKDERYKFELDKREQDLAVKEHALKVKENREKALKFITDNSLPSGIVEIIPLDDWETTLQKLETVKGVVDSDRNSIIENYKTGSGDKPKPGGAPLSVKKKRSEMTASEATAYAREHGVEAYNKLPA